MIKIRGDVSGKNNQFAKSYLCATDANRLRTAGRLFRRIQDFTLPNGPREANHLYGVINRIGRAARGSCSDRERQ